MFNTENFIIIKDPRLNNIIRQDGFKSRAITLSIYSKTFNLRYFCIINDNEFKNLQSAEIRDIIMISESEEIYKACVIMGLINPLNVKIKTT